MGKPDKSEDAYKKSARNKGRLILKNDEKYKKKKKKEKKRLDKIANPEKYAKEPERDDCAAEKIEYKETEEFRLDKAQHFGWWRAEKIDVIKDECIIEFEEEPFRYVLSNDDGTFCLGNRTIEAPPQPQEILVPVPLDTLHGNNKLAFKTGFGRYITVEKSGLLRGIAEAYGPCETFELVFQDGKMAIQSAVNNCFLSVDPETNQLVAIDRKASEEHMCVIRCCRDMSLETKKAKLNMLPKEEHGTLWEAEKNYSRKFQSWVGGTLRLNSASTSSLKKARDDGRLHTEMLQRRSVMKNDKYCK